MEQQKEHSHPPVRPSAATNKRGSRRLAVIRKTTYTLDELPDVIARLRREEASPEETQRRRRLAERARRWQEEMPVIDTPIEDWIRDGPGSH